MHFDKGQLVLVDTNVIIECHRVGCWKGLSGFFHLETVEMCVVETQTGFQNRKPEENIDEAALRASLIQVVKISDREEAEFILDYEAAGTLDPGERHLLCHAAVRKDAWFLCSPDAAAMRFVHGLGQTDRLVSLESLVKRLKFRLSDELRDNYTEAWLSKKRTEMLLG